MSDNTPRVRVISLMVQVSAVTDDGEHLTPVQVQPLTIPAAQWDQWVASGLAGIVEQLAHAVPPEV